MYISDDVTHSGGTTDLLVGENATLQNPSVGWPDAPNLLDSLVWLALQATFRSPLGFEGLLWIRRNICDGVERTTL